VVSFLSRNDGGVGDQGEVDPWVGNKVGRELSQINVEGSIEPRKTKIEVIFGTRSLDNNPRWDPNLLVYHSLMMLLLLLYLREAVMEETI